MRADRLLTLMYLLKARGKISSAELAAELEVSPRTILRDVQALSTAGIPVYSETGRGGGICLLPGHRTDVSALSEEEAGALFAAIAAPGADALGLGDALTSALRKLMAALPDRHRPSAAKVSERIVIDTGGWLPRHHEPWLELSMEAVLEDRRLTILYQGRHNATASERTVDPYGLLNSSGVWYLVAAHHGQPRFYRMARISQATVLKEPSHRPADVNVRELWHQHRERYRKDFTPTDTEMWIRQSRLGDLAGSAVSPLREADSHEWPPAPATAQDWVPIRARFGDISHAWQVVRGLDADAVVISPVDLRDQVRRRASEVLSAYSDVD